MLMIHATPCEAAVAAEQLLRLSRPGPLSEEELKQINISCIKTDPYKWAWCMGVKAAILRRQSLGVVCDVGDVDRAAVAQ